MKTTITFTMLLIAATAISIQTSAAKWRVNNTPESSAQFTTITDAYNAASDGDTIYVEGSASSYSDGLSVIKKIIFIGPGYFLDSNPETQANAFQASFSGSFSFEDGSAGSKVMGMHFSGYIYVYTVDITIERNIFIYSAYVYLIAGYNLDDLKIINNYFAGEYYYTAIYGISIQGNLLIANNFFQAIINIGGTTNFQSIVLINNVFDADITANNAIISNNIMRSGLLTTTNSVISHNIANSTQFGNQNGNLENVDMNTVFVGLIDNSADGQWQLAAGSPAIGAGENGEDCGIFGGSFPYKLSGLPAVPAIYHLDASTVPTNTLNINIKTKSHN